MTVVEQLIAKLVEESELKHWLDLDEEENGVPLEPSDEPTSGYQQYRTLADIRTGQLADARRALTVLRFAESLATPLTREYEFDYEHAANAPAIDDGPW